MSMEKLKEYIGAGDISRISRFLFDAKSGIPKVRTGYHHENLLYDFKTEVPGSGKPHEHAWADIARHILAFHNAEGGLLIFGIHDKTFEFTRARTPCDSARFNDHIRKYIGDLFHVLFSREYIQADQGYLGIALIPARGPRIVRFAADAPTGRGASQFSRGDIAVREGDSSRLYKGIEADEYVSRLSGGRVGRGFFVDDPNYRILHPEYKSFVHRESICDGVMEGLLHPRVAVTSLLGIGGVGKTAIATWAAIEAYRSNQFSFIVSMTAKDRELSAKSILPLERPLTSYEELLDTICHVLQLEEAIQYNTEDKQAFIKEILKDANGLLFVDNLETVDDPRILHFLDHLPLGVRALVTSRISRVQISNYPVAVGPLDDHELHRFVEAMTTEPAYVYLSGLSAGERLTFGTACNRIPLAMRWIAARCKTPREALRSAEDINRRSTTSEQLLEFSFRRIFERLSAEEKIILQVLSIYERPQPLEAIHIASDIAYSDTGDILSSLQSSSLVEMAYDEVLNGNTFNLLSITRAFVYGEVKKTKGLEDSIRRRMADWLDARDVAAPVDRIIARGLRQGQTSSEEMLLQMAKQQTRTEDADRLYEEATRRNPKGWMAHRRYAEFLRHSTSQTSRAIQEYRLALLNLPKHLPKRESALVHREFGLLLKQSGDPNGLNESTESLRAAVKLNPEDELATHALADNYRRMGQYDPAIQFADKLRHHHNEKTRELALRLLIQCYEGKEDMVEVALLKQELGKLQTPH